jgi:hypothetical protein
MPILGIVIDGKFRMHLYKDGEIDVEFIPKSYPASFFELIKKKKLKVVADLDLITSKLEIRNVILNGEWK